MIYTAIALLIIYFIFFRFKKDIYFNFHSGNSVLIGYVTIEKDPIDILGLSCLWECRIPDRYLYKSIYFIPKGTTIMSYRGCRRKFRKDIVKRLQESDVIFNVK